MFLWVCMSDSTRVSNLGGCEPRSQREGWDVDLSTPNPSAGVILQVIPEMVGLISLFQSTQPPRHTQPELFLRSMRNRFYG